MGNRRASDLITDSPPEAAARPVSLGLVGCGRISQVAHLPALAKVEGIRVAAICDTSQFVASEVARRHGVRRATTRVDDLIADPSLEALLIAIPDRFHREVAEAAIKAGKHVLVEKPLAPTVDESRVLAEAAELADVKLQVGAMKRHDPGVRYARRAISAELGEVHTFNAWYRISSLRPKVEAALFPSIVDDPRQRRDPTYKDDRERYYLLTHGSHLFDGLRYLLGQPEEITAKLVRSGKDLSWRGLWRLSSGAIGAFELTVGVHAPAAEGYEIFGSRGAVHVDTHFPFFRRASDVRVFDAKRETWVEPELGAADPYQRQLEAFVRSIRFNEPTDPDGWDGLAALQMIDAVERSTGGLGAVAL